MTAVEYLINELSKSKYFHRVLNEINDNSTTQKDVLKEALELEKQQSQDYAKFAINCDRKEMPILNFEDYIKL